MKLQELFDAFVDFEGKLYVGVSDGGIYYGHPGRRVHSATSDGHTVNDYIDYSYALSADREGMRASAQKVNSTRKARR